ncbi:MAG: LysR family transcriptional regulator [Burkholderiales bacterium]|nr:LysR family transcriptional regulator [Burkholderiales bacterium]
MDRLHLPLNALRAFEASARHLNFTRAAAELCITQAAVSRHVIGLEARLGVSLFRRVPRGLALTDEGAALVPILTASFDRMASALNQFADGSYAELLTVSVVGTFAVGWLMPRLAAFHAAHPRVDLRLFTNNNRVELATEGIDFAIRFGDGNWLGVEATPIFRTPLTPMCAPNTAARLASPHDLVREPLLRSYRPDEWPCWFTQAGVPCPVLRGPQFDSSPALAMAAGAGLGVALLPAALFDSEVASGRLTRPFALEIDVGGYWLARAKGKDETPAMRAFRGWLMTEATAP